MNKPITVLLSVLLVSVSSPIGDYGKTATAQAAALVPVTQSVATLGLEPAATSLTTVVPGRSRAAEAVPASPRDTAVAMARARYHSEASVQATVYVLQHESNFNPSAINPSSGACGLAQRLPCRDTHTLSVEEQLTDFFNYVDARYGGPLGAQSFWITNNWY